MKFGPGLKKIGVTREFRPGANKYFFTSFHPGVKLYAKICGIFYKNVLHKRHVSYVVPGLYKTDFINKRSKIFNFKTFKIVLLATMNSIIGTTSLLRNSYTVLLLKIYNQKRQLDILIKDAIIFVISRNIVFEKVKRLKTRYVKVIQHVWL